MVGGWWLVVGGWWLVVGGWWLVAGGWWLGAPSLNRPVVNRRLQCLTWAGIAGLIALGSVSSSSVSAQAPGPPPAAPLAGGENYDPPSRVGRLTGISGTVSFRAAADTEWGVANPNRPITTGDRVWSDNDGQGEIQIGTASTRVWHQTELDIIRLGDNDMQLSVPQGSVILRLSGFTAGDAHEIDTPNSAVTPQTIGDYRVDVSADGQTTTVTVWSGSAEVTSAGSSFALTSRQSATIQGVTSPTYDVAGATSTDGFDAWSQTLDQREDQRRSQLRIERHGRGR